ncbi:MAG TPA: glycine cleavage system protein GcvH [Pseudomonadales bacterium]|nr:glycine cleavage system protein GcvH [Pseudomonadales bacterium]
MQTPDDIKYLASHQWGRLEADGTVTVGITDYAQDQLGDVVFVDLPAVGTQLTQKGEAGVIESVKTASDLFAPVSGKVIAINPKLEETPEIVNDSPYAQGWLFKVEPDNAASEWHDLLDAAGYQQAVAAEQDD